MDRKNFKKLRKWDSNHSEGKKCTYWCLPLEYVCNYKVVSLCCIEKGTPGYLYTDTQGIALYIRVGTCAQIHIDTLTASVHKISFTLIGQGVALYCALTGQGIALYTCVSTCTNTHRYTQTKCAQIPLYRLDKGLHHTHAYIYTCAQTHIDTLTPSAHKIPVTLTGQGVQTMHMCKYMCTNTHRYTHTKCTQNPHHNDRTRGSNYTHV